LDFTWNRGDPRLASDLIEVAKAAETAGVTRISLMDHFWQVPHLGAPGNTVPEPYSTLAFLAGHTKRLQLHTMVTSVTYREPALLAKIVSTLDVLSGGRAALGIGAGSHTEEAVALGLPMAPVAERFDRLEEVIQICKQVWSGSEEPYRGRYYRLERTLVPPRPLHTPKLMIGGGGEHRTLRLVAKYADACNIHVSPDSARKLQILREHCDREGRDYDDIEKTAGITLAGGVEPGPLLEQLRHLHDLGYTATYVQIPGFPLQGVEVLGNEVIPEARTW